MELYQLLTCKPFPYIFREFWCEKEMKVQNFKSSLYDLASILQILDSVFYTIMFLVVCFSLLITVAPFLILDSHFQFYVSNLKPYWFFSLFLVIALPDSTSLFWVDVLTKSSVWSRKQYWLFFNFFHLLWQLYYSNIMYIRFDRKEDCSLACPEDIQSGGADKRIRIHYGEC